jgi:hypothetical protein
VPARVKSALYQTEWEINTIFHDWVEERSPDGYLMHIVDDATKTVPVF